MITIKKGDTITVTDMRSGSGQSDWWLCKVKAEKGNDSITLWCNNFYANEGDTVQVIEILEVKKGARKFNEKWYDTYDVTAVLEKVNAEFEELDDGGDLPF